MVTLRKLCVVALLAIIAVLAFADPTPEAPGSRGFAVGMQYDTTHVYVSVSEFEHFVASFSATFGGIKTKPIELQVTPTASRARSQLVLTPSGSVSVFGFETPIPYPFGEERNGYLVADIDGAVSAAMAAGAMRRTATFPDPVGRDAIIQWPGGVSMQLYWHSKAPDYAELQHAPEARIYLTSEATAGFSKAWVAFSHGRIVSDDRTASGAEIGRPKFAIRRLVIDSAFGPTVILVSDGILPWPFGRETTGYGVEDLGSVIARARGSRATLVAGPFVEAGSRRAALVNFPGGYIAEIHEVTRP